MSSRDAGLLTFKALSIYAGIRGLEQMSKMIRAGIGENETEFWFLSLIQMLLPPLILLACAIWLWFAAPVLSKRIFSPAEAKEGTFATLDEIQSLVFSAIGLLVLAWAIPDLIRSVVITYVSIHDMPEYKPSSEMLMHRAISIGTTLAKLVLGFWLFLGYQGFVRALRKLRRD